jgi:hypothetical protein
MAATPNPKLATPAQKQQLSVALLSAFPTEADLRTMVGQELNASLDEVAPHDENLRNQVFVLIQWAIAQGREDDLIQGALHANPGNPILRAFVTGGPRHRAKTRKDEPPAPAAAGADLADLIAELEHHATKVRAAMDEEEARDLTRIRTGALDLTEEDLKRAAAAHRARFRKLHAQHLEALRKGHLVFAHELSNEIDAFLHPPAQEASSQTGGGGGREAWQTKDFRNVQYRTR